MADDKGEPFVDPLAPGGSAHGYQWISPPPEPEPEPVEPGPVDEASAILTESMEEFLERRRERLARREGFPA